MHQRVDLELCVVKGVRGRLLHLPVDDLPHPRVQAHLGGTERKWGLGDTQGQAPSPLHPSQGKLGNNAAPDVGRPQCAPSQKILALEPWWLGKVAGRHGDLSGCPLCSPAGHREMVWSGPILGTPLQGCCKSGCSIFSARWCPREVSAPQHNPAHGPTASSVPGVLGGWICPCHRCHPAKLIPKLSQGSGSSWN